MTRPKIDAFRSQLVRLATTLSTACFGAAAISCAAPAGADPTAGDAPPALYAANAGPFLDVTANGTGCPAGTWTSDVSEDGTTFAVSFNAYEASVAPGSSFSIKDCTLSIKLANEPGRQYAVESISYHGAAKLDAGVRTTVSAIYWFQGDPAAGQELATDLTGPYEQNFEFYDAPEPEALGWSPCGFARDLNVTSRIVLRNAAGASGTSNVSLNSVEGSAQLVVRLAARGC